MGKLTDQQRAETAPQVAAAGRDDPSVREATVGDGAGAPRRRASVGIARGRIEAVDAHEKIDAPRKLDAGGLILAPGFIDTHSHSDLRLLVEPGLPMKVRQGVTLEVLG